MERVLIIGGFHRSGTSLAAQTLQRAGLWLGDDLVGANEHNIHGHVEDAEIVNFHDAALADTGLSWLLGDPAAPRFGDQHRAGLAALVAARRAQHDVWGFKDPRVTLFLDDWQEAIDTVGFLFPVRDPAAAVKSLYRRHTSDLLAARGDSAVHRRLFAEPDLALRSWLAYNRRIADFGARDDTRTLIVAFEELSNGPELVDAVGALCDVELHRAETGVFDGGAVHGASTPLEVWDPTLVDEVADVWERLDALAGGSLPPLDAGWFRTIGGSEVASLPHGGVDFLDAAIDAAADSRQDRSERDTFGRKAALADELRGRLTRVEENLKTVAGERDATRVDLRDTKALAAQVRDAAKRETARVVEERERAERRATEQTVRLRAAIETADSRRGQIRRLEREGRHLTDRLARHERLVQETIEDLELTQRSKRWRVGGIVTTPARLLRGGGGREDAVSRSLRRLHGATAAPAGAPTAGGDVEHLVNELADAGDRLLSSRRWRIGRAMLAPVRWIRRPSDSADRRIRSRVRPDPRDRAAVHRYAREQLEDAEAVVSSRAYALGAAIIGRLPGGVRRGGEPAIGRIRAIAATVDQLPGRNALSVADDYLQYQKAVEPSVLAQVAQAADSPVGVLSLEAVASAGDWDAVRRSLASLETDYVAIAGAADELAAPMQKVRSGPDALVFDWDVLEDGRRTRPWFQLGVSADLLSEHDVIRRAVVFRRQALLDLDDVDPGHLHRDALLQILTSGGTVEAVNAIGLHVTALPSAADRARSDNRFAELAVARIGGSGVARGRHDRARIEYRAPASTKVSIIIPFRDRVDLLRVAIDSIERLTTHPRYELVLVDNESSEPEMLDYLDDLKRRDDVTVVDVPGPFNFSHSINVGVAASTGDVVVLLNNDVRVLEPDWLTLLAGQALRDGVGAVGARLHFADGSIQHVGVVVGLEGFAAHIGARAQPRVLPAPLVDHARDVSAVTAACLAVSRANFDLVEGLDESFEVTGNDVDFCLRLGAAGLRNVIEPDARLFHYEKQSRSSIPTRTTDQVLSLERYEPYLTEGDPYFNTNLSLESTIPRPRTGANPSPDNVRKAVAQSIPTPDRPAKGYLLSFDIDDEALAANAAVIAADQPGLNDTIASATWFLPVFDHAYRGGIYTILRFADALTRRVGCTHRIVLCGGAPGAPDEIAARIREAFPELDFEVALLADVRQAGTLPPTDAGFATLWTTAYALAHFNNCRSKYYFVQDYEPAFEPANEIFGLIEATYRFGFTGLCNTPGVADAYAAYGSPATSFVPAVDHRYTASPEAPGGPIRIVFYGRPTNPRNGFELGIEALRLVKERFGDAVDIVSAGAVWEPAAYDLAGVVTNLGVLPGIEAVAELYRSSHIGLVFMFTKHPSYQPLEYMASGCVTVTNFNEANLWLLRDGENCLLSPPTLSCVVERISRLVEDADLRAELRSGGLATTAKLDWENELDNMVRSIVPGWTP